MAPDVQGNAMLGKVLCHTGGTKEMTESLIVKKEALKCSGKVYSEQHRRNFDIKDDILQVKTPLTMKAG
jgi:hypothetical protein